SLRHRQARGRSAAVNAPPGSPGPTRSSISESSASGRRSRPSWRASWRTTACSSPAARAARSSTRPGTSKWPSPAPSSHATASPHGTSARSGRRPTARLADPATLRRTVDLRADWIEPRKPDVILGAEARGFILSAAIAYKLGCGFVAARRPGKLPWETVSATYALEYGENSLELHADAIAQGQRVLVHDDVLATGGTAAAICNLAEQLGGEVVGTAFVIELAFL